MNNEISKLFSKFEAESRYSAKLRPETIRGYKAVFNLFLKIMPEIRTVRSLKKEMLNEFFKRIETRERLVGKSQIKKGVKASTTKTHYYKLNSFFEWLSKNIPKFVNPLQSISPPKVVYNDSKRLSDSEIHRVYSSVTLHSSNSFIQRRDTMIISLLSFCGLRKGELISLRVNDIDLERSQITVRGETSKSKITRVLSIHPTLAMHIRDYFMERNNRGLRTEYLIASNGVDRNLSREGLKHWVESLKKKSGVKFHLHQFRHTFGCKLAENDTSAFKIQKMMGHSSLSMTRVYVRSLRTEEMYDDISKISF